MSETSAMPGTERPDVVLLIASGCAICPVVHKILSQLHADGKINQFEVVNISEHPDLAQSYGVRSVPWFRIGALEFQGLHSAAELDYWVGHALADDGIKRYITEELEAGHLSSILRLIKQHPHWLKIALAIIADLQAPIQARIGLGAVFEELQGSPLLQEQVPGLSELTQHTDRQIRADACYYLGLSRSSAAVPALNQCLQDADPEVREIAQEALADMAH